MSCREFAECDKSKVVFIDVETTGLDEIKDEILSLAIVDFEGNVLFSELVKPPTRKRWPNAQKINGISWSDVKDKPQLSEHLDEIEKYFAEDMIVAGYNVWFDMGFLFEAEVPIKTRRYFDVMDAYTDAISNGKRVKLVSAAKHYRYQFDAHDAAEDAKACAHVARRMLESKKFKEWIDVDTIFEEESCKETVREYSQNEKTIEEKKDNTLVMMSGIILFCLALLIVMWALSMTHI